MTLTREEVERALIPAVKRDGLVSLTAGTVTGPRHVDGQIVDGPTGPVGQEGYVLNVDGHRLWLPFDGVSPSHLAAIAALSTRIATLERKASGTVMVSVKASAGGAAAVTFPTGLFTAADALTAQVSKGGDSFAKSIPYFRNLTRTGMTVGVYSGDGTTVTSSSVPIHWRVEAI